MESCRSIAGMWAPRGFQPQLLLEGPSPSPLRFPPHLLFELAQVFMQLPGELEQGNALARKENGFKWQFFISIGVTTCPYQQLCQLSGGNGTWAGVIQQGGEGSAT